MGSWRGSGGIISSAETGAANSISSARTSPPASPGRLVTRPTRPLSRLRRSPRRPNCQRLTLRPTSVTAAGVTSAAPSMLSVVATIAPTADDSSTLPGERKNDTAMIATSRQPANSAVRPAVFAASEAACFGARPSSRLSLKRVMINSE